MTSAVAVTVEVALTSSMSGQSLNEHGELPLSVHDFYQTPRERPRPERRRPEPTPFVFEDAYQKYLKELEILEADGRILEH